MKIKKKSNAVRVPPVQKAIKVKRKSVDAEGESTVKTALENVKKVLQKKSAEAKVTIPQTKKVNVTKVNVKKQLKQPRPPRGIVYLGHIPHGFYEEQMEDYFKQFGRVLRVRVARSKNTGNSRGYGYVEFLHPDVAKVAAETMNNYLMCGRLLKATYIPPEKQHKRYFVGKPWSKTVYPRLLNRNKVSKMRNTIIGKNEHSNFVKSTMSKLSTLEKKLKEEGFDLKFQPVDAAKV